MLLQAKQVKSSKSLWLNYYVVLQPAARKSRSQMLFKTGVLTNFSKFIGKNPCQSLFFNDVAGFRSAALLERDPGTGIFL